MTNKEAVIAALKESSCQTSKQITAYCMRKFNYEITPSAVGGALRSLIREGKAASSNCGNGTTVYWICEHEWEK